jgi:uncharacterized phage infection (PIP) family protein YhgE
MVHFQPSANAWQTPRFISDSHGNTHNVFVDSNQPLADKLFATDRKVAELDGQYDELIDMLDAALVDMRREYLEMLDRLDATVKQMALTIERVEKGFNDALNAGENHQETKNQLVDAKKQLTELQSNVGSIEKMLGVRKFHHIAQANRGNLKSPVLQNIQAKTKEQVSKIDKQDKRTATLERQMQMVSSFFHR